MGIILKTAAEIDGIRKAGHIARGALNHIAPHIQAGITTLAINEMVEAYLAEHGAIAATKGYKGYPASSCISLNDVICHGIPSDKDVLKDGDIVNVDVTAILNGFYGDTCRMYLVGDVSPEAQKLVEVTKECLNLGIKQCYPGNYLSNIGFAISNYARRNGYSVVTDFCGHGVGIKFHEDPEVLHEDSRNRGPKLRPGMTFTIEPMINQGKARSKVDRLDGWTARTIDGKLSAQFEHTVLITPSGVEVLTDIDNEYPIS